MSFPDQKCVNRLTHLIEEFYGDIPKDRIEYALNDIEKHGEYEIAYDFLVNDIFEYDVKISFKLLVCLKFYHIYFYGKEDWKKWNNIYREQLA